ncbi:copper chaperone PCu(A)C [Streptomyces sp. P38-E01]|uniref:Copper chaperone PCu(A)C n=1 Tax=Streptomyces tardus TaxID=2780544 RepID=A0A949JJ01_9ACTN|nr:DUF461 domain-containing protein [Streptomyces tardus]MBU7597129.1 copper chaperone PCu(A)C [Streptomyces tardus]
MSSSLRRGAVAASVIALSTLSLGACGAGFDAQTSGVRPDNASVSVDDIKIQNINVVTSEESGSPVAVTARIFNDGNKDEKLTSITVRGAGKVELEPADKGDLVVPAGGSLKLGGEGNASAQIADASGITEGNAQSVSFKLSETGSLSADATVVPAGGQYADWGPTPPASPSPSEDGQESPGNTESPGADSPGDDESPEDADSPGAQESEGTEESPAA